MCFEYDGYNEFQVDTYPKARKQHRCDGCWKAIERGEKYHRCVGKFDGEMFVLRACYRCTALTEAIEKIEIENGCTGSEATPPLCDLLDIAREYEMYPTYKADQPKVTA